MPKTLLMLCLAALAGPATGPAGRSPADERESIHHLSMGRTMPDAQQANRIRGKTLRWTWTEGPVAGTTHEHDFHQDGTVEWRVVDGPQAGHSAREKAYAAIKVADDVYLVSYLAASGYTLTVALNLRDGTMVGIASNSEAWYPEGRGTFEVVE